MDGTDTRGSLPRSIILKPPSIAAPLPVQVIAGAAERPRVDATSMELPRGTA
jgi:hypothetical protein